METGQNGLSHEVRHQIFDPALERIIGPPQKLLTVKGDSLEFKVRTVHHEGKTDDDHLILLLGEVLDQGRRFDRFGRIIAHGSFGFSTREYCHGKELKFGLGVLWVRLGEPQDTWLDHHKKIEIFEQLASWEKRFSDPLFARLTGVAPEKHPEKTIVETAVGAMSSRMFTLSSIRS